MEIITDKINHEINIFDYFDKYSCFIDIETTGFSRDKELIYLIGLLYYDKTSNIWILNQYFANNKNKEEKLLKKFLNDITNFENIITYNGDSFDIPFINHRANLYNIDSNISKNISFDIYRYIRKNEDFLELKNFKLKTIEESLGYYREDIYSGYDCIAFYKEYTKTQNKNLKNKILKHNYDDLIHMLDILDIFNVINNKKSIKIQIMNNKRIFKIKKLQFAKDTLLIQGELNKSIDYDIKNYQKFYTVESFNKTNLEYNINVEKGYITQKDIAYFINLDNLNLNITSEESNKYNIPNNIFILQIENKPIIKNIKILLSKLTK